MQLSTALQYVIAKDSKLHGGQQHKTTPSGNSKSQLLLGHNVVCNPGQWRPHLSLDTVLKNQPVIMDRRNNMPCSRQVQLITHEVLYRGTEPNFILEDSYEVQGADPRGIFYVLTQRQLSHTFVFLNPEHPWFDDIYGLRRVSRKVAYIKWILMAFINRLLILYLKRILGNNMNFISKDLVTSM